MDLIEEYRDKWRKIGFSTTETSFERAGCIIRRVYQIGKLKPPSRILLVDSPWACLYAWLYFKNSNHLKQLKPLLRGNLHPFLRNIPQDKIFASPPNLHSDLKAGHFERRLAYESLITPLSQGGGTGLILTRNIMNVKSIEMINHKFQ